MLVVILFARFFYHNSIRNTKDTIMNQKQRYLVISTIVLLCLDAIYLTLNQKKLMDELTHVQRVIVQIRWVGVILCYLFLIVGINYFILQQKRSVAEAFLLGVVIYGVYDTTNYATLKRWTESLAIMDTLWGGSLFALTTYFTYKINDVMK